MDQAGRVRQGAAGGSGDAGKKLGDTGGLGGDLNLIGLERGQGGVCGDHTDIAGRPGHGADGIGDVHVVAKGDPLELPGLSLGKAVILRRWGLGLDHLNAIDVLVDKDPRARAADAFDDSSDEGDSGSSGTAHGGAGVPGAGAGGPIDRDREGCRGVGATALDNKLRVDAEDGAADGILAGGGKEQSATGVDGEVGAGAQRYGLHASAAGVAAALAEAAGEGDDKGDGQRKKKTGTATMHEPSSRPFAGRELDVVERKAVSVEGQVQGFKASKPQVSKFQGFRVSKTEDGEARSQATWDL